MAEVQIKQLPAQLALVVRQRVKQRAIAAGMGEAFDTLMRHAGATGAQYSGPPFSIYPEMPSDDFTMLVCMPVLPGAVAGDDVELQQIPATEAAVLLHRGPYDRVSPSWQALMEWVGRSGRRPAGPVREVYLSDPESTAPENLVTELVVPLN